MTYNLLANSEFDIFYLYLLIKKHFLLPIQFALYAVGKGVTHDSLSHMDEYAPVDFNAETWAARGRTTFMW